MRFARAESERRDLRGQEILNSGQLCLEFLKVQAVQPERSD
jgi:hypothetical protein